MFYKWTVTVLMSILLAMSGVQAAEQESNPAQLVQDVSDKALAVINKNRVEFQAHPKKIKVFADQYVLPYMDAAKMARYSMGRYWRVASKAQQKAFVSAYIDMLMRSYAGSLLKLNVASINVKPARTEAPGRVLVNSSVKQTNGKASKLVFRLYLNKHTQKWMMYDVSIEGISLLLNYRKSFASDFSTKSIDSVILAMQKKNKDFLNGDVPMTKQVKE